MLKTISASNLRIHVRRVLDEVHYTEADYIVEKFGQPAAAIISMADYELLQVARERSDSAQSKEPAAQTPLVR